MRRVRKAGEPDDKAPQTNRSDRIALAVTILLLAAAAIVGLALIAELDFTG